ncbi:MAG: histidinol phosphate phosphatase [Latescibacteria bacterium DG_63]|nr:MAG: histidinol phosphate phosphatase [Latescibacteria bacterium DG_63]
MKRKELEALREAAVCAAERAGKILTSRASLRRRIEFKGKVNLVTEVDRLAEEAIVRYLRKRFANHSFLAEETGGSELESEFLWIIDPLDGTTNYAHGFPVYSVSIGLRYLDSVVLGVVYNPNLDELFTATLNGGARLNGKKIGVSKTRSLTRSLLATGFPYDIRESRDNNLNHFSAFALRAQAVRRAGSAALDLCYLACGRFDGFWELKLSPWDVAAGSLIVTEAGGRVSDFSGGEFDIFSKEMLASNGRIHNQMLRTLWLHSRPRSSKAGTTRAKSGRKR